MFVAEVDGNRTRRTRVARPNRFEGGGAHQVPGHLHAPPKQRLPHTLVGTGPGRVSAPGRGARGR